jgi:hypothetical protein
MDGNSYPDVASFLIRFVQGQPTEDGGARYRGVVRHVQTDQELSFTSWQEVEAFIQLVIPLETTKTDIGD